MVVLLLWLYLGACSILIGGEVNAAIEQSREDQVQRRTRADEVRSRTACTIVFGVRWMKASDFRRIALSLEGADKSWHMGAPDFRVGGRVFRDARLPKTGYAI